MAQLKKSDNSTLNASINTFTARNMVKVGHAVVVTPGVTGFDVIRLKTPALDAAHVAATPSSPILPGVDDLRFTPLQYPEKF